MLADIFKEKTNIDEQAIQRAFDIIATSPRGFLALWPDDVIAVVNGERYTISDKLRAKRERNAHNLANKRRPTEPELKPAFITVFDNGPIIPYGGKWTGIQTHKRYWTVERQGNRDDLQMMIMQAFPLGLLPDLYFYREWQEAFMHEYHHPVPHREKRHGQVVAWLLLDAGRIIDVYAWRPNTASSPTAADGGGLCPDC